MFLVPIKVFKDRYPRNSQGPDPCPSRDLKIESRVEADRFPANFRRLPSTSTPFLQRFGFSCFRPLSRGCCLNVCHVSFAAFLLSTVLLLDGLQLRNSMSGRPNTCAKCTFWFTPCKKAFNLAWKDKTSERYNYDLSLIKINFALLNSFTAYLFQPKRVEEKF